jgi:hypothetical protein
LRPLCRSGFIDITEANELDALVGTNRGQISPAHSIDTNAGNLQILLQNAGSHKSGSRKGNATGECGLFKKLTAL